MKRTLPIISLCFLALGTIWFTLIAFDDIYFGLSEIKSIKGAYTLEFVPTWQKLFIKLPIIVFELLFITSNVSLLISIIKKSKRILIVSLILTAISLLAINFYSININIDIYNNLMLSEFIKLREFSMDFMLDILITKTSRFIKFIPFFISTILSSAELIRIGFINKKADKELNLISEQM